MANASVEKVQKKKNKKGKGSKVICFDEEVVPKSIAEGILAQESLRCAQEEQKCKESTNQKRKKKKKKKSELKSQSEIVLIENDIKNCSIEKINKNQNMQEHKSDDCVNEVGQEETNGNKKMKKRKKSEKIHDDDNNKDNSQINQEVDDEIKPRKKRKKNITPELEPQENDAETVSTGASEPKKKESIRERKRKKYAQLLKEKKMTTELVLQQKSLNYLSRWKHSRDEWKFEKLRQIWLQQNIYDVDKIPQEFWETLMEYFTNSKGKIKDLILKDALKIIEAANTEDEEDGAKLQRARDVIQNLQE